MSETLSEAAAKFRRLDPDDERLLNALLDKIADLKCPHCGKPVGIEIELK